MDKNQHITSLLETPKSSPPVNNNGLCFWNKPWSRSRPRPRPRPRLQSDEYSCVVCLHVHKIRGFLPSMNGQAVCVEWKSKGCRREKTLPAQVCEGSANFDEIFLHYCSLLEVQSVLKAIVVSVSLMGDEEMIDSNLGTFKIDLSEVVMGDEEMNPKVGGKIASYDVQGIACGGVLSIGVYCRMLEEAAAAAAAASSCSYFNDHRQPKMKCLSCLPNFKSLKIKPQSEPARNITSLPSEPAESRHYSHEDEDEGFITIEKGIVRRPPSDDLRNTDDDEEEEGDNEVKDEKPCLVMDEVDKVEDEFLRMLEAKKNCKAKMADRKGKGVEVSYWSSSDMDLDALIKEAEVELNRAKEAWKRRVGGGGAMLEEEEYEELIKRWGSNIDKSSSSSSDYCYRVYGAFGSPF